MEKKRPKYIGFLTSTGDAEGGVVGGFLILNLVGRPVEFHCTAPVRPNRAQEILFGSTLEGFMCGEQIAPALVGKTKLELAAVLTNKPAMLTAPSSLGVPLALVFQHGERVEANGEAEEERFEDDDQLASDFLTEDARKTREYVAPTPEEDANAKTFFYPSLEDAPFVPGIDYRKWRETTIGVNRIAVPRGFLSETTGKISFEECVARIEPFFRAIDSVEPFERIRLAVEEAQRAG